MRHWSQLATRNLRARQLRTLGAVAAIALGTAAVVWVSCCYESVRQTVLVWAGGYIGRAHISVESQFGKYDVLPQRLVDRIARLPEVKHVTPLLVRRLRGEVVRAADLGQLPAAARRVSGSTPEIDLHGIDLATEFNIRTYDVSAGRMLRPDDEYVCLLEASYAEEFNVTLGDRVLIWGGSRDEPYELEIVGLIKRRRIARFQKGLTVARLTVAQEISDQQALITSADVILHDTAGGGIERGRAAVRSVVDDVARSAIVRSAAARMQQVEKAQQQQQVILLLLSCVAMLTALFIILSTLSMGMVERIAQLGLLRCIGMTRAQLAWLVLVEVAPLGLGGIALGVPIGFALTFLTVVLVPDYVDSFTIAWDGVALAVGAGLATTILAAILPAIAALTVSPMEAARPRARREGWRAAVATLVLAIGLLAVQHFVVMEWVQRDVEFVRWAATSVVLLYLVYAAAAPIAVGLLGSLAVVLISRVVRVRVLLLQDQIGHAIWRSAGICCGLMVGLSLIVGLVVFNESFKAGWQFPKQFPEAYFWSFQQVPMDRAAELRGTPGLGDHTLANAMNVIVEEAPALMERVQLSVTWFLGVDPDSFFRMVRLEFVQGDEQTALALLKRGGYVLVAADFARTRRKGVEDLYDDQGRQTQSNTVRVRLADRWRTFKIAGVIDSPALDIAAGYFQAESEMRVVASGSVLGTNADLKRQFDIDGLKMVLLNFDLGPAPLPANWPPPRGTAAAAGIAAGAFDDSVPLAARWQRHREAQVLEQVYRRLNAPQAFVGTARELKAEIDSELSRVTRLLTAVPAVALLVAALGVANLMTANVASRARQIAILRAVGATRGLVLRLVVGEALVLGALGSGLGLLLGLHLAWNITQMTQRMWGFATVVEVPWLFVGAAIALTVGLCLIAGLAPARRASRTNVIDALHVA